LELEKMEAGLKREARKSESRSWYKVFLRVSFKGLMAAALV
jgi:hypothetical protein